MHVALMENTGQSIRLGYLLDNDGAVLKISILTGFSFSGTVWCELATYNLIILDLVRTYDL